MKDNQFEYVWEELDKYQNRSKHNSILAEAITMKNAKKPDDFVFQGISVHDGQTDFERLSKRFIDFMQNGANADPMSNPVNLVSKIKNQYKIVRYYFISQLLGWHELEHELKKQLDYYKYTDIDLQEIKKYIDAHKSSWTSEYQKAINLIKKSGVSTANFEDYFIKSMMNDFQNKVGGQASLSKNKTQTNNNSDDGPMSETDFDNIFDDTSANGIGIGISLGNLFGGSVKNIHRVSSSKGSTNSASSAFQFDFNVPEDIYVKNYVNTDWAKNIRKKVEQFALAWKVIIVATHFYVKDWEPLQNKFTTIFGDVTFKLDPNISQASYAALI